MRLSSIDPVHSAAPAARPSDATTVRVVHMYSVPIVRELPIPPAPDGGTW